MKKIDFLQQLDLNLKELGVAQDVIDEQVYRVKTYLDEAAMEEIDINPADMARGIVETLEAEETEDEASDEVPDDEAGADEEAAAVEEAAPEEETEGCGEAAAEEAAEAAEETEEDAAGAGVMIIPGDIFAEEPEVAPDTRSAADLPAFDEAANETGKPEASDEEADADNDLIAAIAISNDRVRRTRAAREEAEAARDAGNAADEFDDDSDMKIADTSAKSNVADEVSAGQNDYDEDIEQFLPPNSARLKELRSRQKQNTGAVANSDVHGNSGDAEGNRSEKPEQTGGKTFFWVLFCIAVPFAAILAAAIAVLYVFFWVALAALMIFSIALLIAFVTVGTVVSLTGIVYGVVQLVKGLGLTPIGLFEIGLGITVGAVVLFVGILIYNFAIRLIPFAMKQLARLVGFTFRKGREVFIAAKGACERL